MQKKIEEAFEALEVKKIVESSSGAGKNFEPLEAKLLGARNQVFREETTARNRSAGNREFNKNEFIPLSSRELASHKDASFLIPRSSSEKIGQKDYHPIDYIDNLKEDEETRLSTKEFHNFEYYSQLRSMIDPLWRPIVKERVGIMETQGRIIRGKNQITKILLTMGRSGKLLKIEVIGSTEYYELDQAAVDSIRRISTFPEPPKSMIDSDGNVKVRWDFVLEVNNEESPVGSSSMKD